MKEFVKQATPYVVFALLLAVTWLAWQEVKRMQALKPSKAEIAAANEIATAEVVEEEVV